MQTPLDLHDYSGDFYAHVTARATPSAEILVPILQKLLAPKSVLDVGCGEGVWLRTFLDSGVTDVFGVDGYAPKEGTLAIPSQLVHVQDLSQPLDLRRRFDLVISLEVGEHLPTKSIGNFVSSLVGHGDVLAFSAALPEQGGTRHINEQLPEYWDGLFARHDYLRIDAIRPLIWKNEKVAWWYRQNICLYVKAARKEELFPNYTQPADPDRLTLISERSLKNLVLRNRTFKGACKTAIYSLKKLFG